MHLSDCIKATILTLLLSSITFANQDSVQTELYTTNNVDYSSLPEYDFNAHDTLSSEVMRQVDVQVESYNSDEGVKIAEELFINHPTTPETWGLYAWALFRNGQWEKAIALLDSGISVYGANPDFINQRANFYIEMSQLGLSKRSVDGASVYKNYYEENYDEKQFIEACYRAALHDLLFLTDSYKNRYEELYVVANLYRLLGEHDKSNEYAEMIETAEGYEDDAMVLQVQNGIALKNCDESLKKLDILKAKYPREPFLYNLYAEAYKTQGDTTNLVRVEREQQFWTWVPPFAELAYSDSTYEILNLFHQGITPMILGLDEYDSTVTGQKMKMIEVLAQAPSQEVVDIFISVLYVHANHGNAVESTISDKLVSFGALAVPSVTKLLHYPQQSTCGMTNAASILAEIQDPSSWEELVKSLDFMQKVQPMIIPPSLPQVLFEYDEKRATVLLIEKLQEENLQHRYLYISPLKDIKEKKLRKIAKKILSEEALEKLIEEVYEPTP